MPTSEKPGIDIRSEKVWIEERTQILADFIAKRTKRKAYSKTLIRWAEELLRRIKERVDMEE